jgi:hypothetical protein
MYTPYPDVNAILQQLLAEVQLILGKQFIGMYLHGSLAGGDFDPQKSDIDYVVVTADELPDESISALKAMHARLSAAHPKWGPELEGSYIPQQALRRYDPTDRWYPAIRRGEEFYTREHGRDWVIQRHILRQQGFVLAGPAPQTLIDPNQPDDLREAAVGVMDDWYGWALQPEDKSHLRPSGYQAYAILTMCRVLYTLQYGAAVSKPVAARWAQETLGEPWPELIEQALTWQPGEELDSLNETLDFIQYTLECSRSFETPMRE